MASSLTQLAQAAMFFAAAFPAIVLHEVSHGYAARLLGDPTAERAGRLSLNPLRHVDPFGTLLLPALLALAGWPVFGYAKPVPINPHFFKNYRWGMLLTGLAGPATNFVIAVVAGLAFRLLAPLGPMQSGVGALVVSYLYFLVYVDLLLMFFNLIPIPPFDGSRVLPVFLSDRAMQVYAQVERYGFIIILALLWFGGNIVGTYFSITVDPLLRLIVGG